jgi:hypothetical protein
MVVDAPWYVSNATLHADLGISYVHEVIHQKWNKHHTRLETHVNQLLKTLLAPWYNMFPMQHHTPI